jgi:hypothetical protein
VILEGDAVNELMTGRRTTGVGFTVTVVVAVTLPAALVAVSL